METMRRNSLSLTRTAGIHLADSIQGIVATQDENIQRQAPTGKIKYKKRWNLKLTSSVDSFNLNQSVWSDLFSYQSYNCNNLADAEIHVVWVPHVPLDTTQDIHMTIDCVFTQTSDDERKVLGTTVFPIGLASHSIFRPGHSVSIGVNHQLPWALRFRLSDNIFESNYTYAEAYVCLIGFKTPIGMIDEKRGASLISLMPLTENFSGISLERPRVYGENWKVKSFSLGFKAAGDVNKVLRLQEIGIDVEALMASGKLEKVLKNIKLSDLKIPNSEAFKFAMGKIKQCLSSR